MRSPWRRFSAIRAEGVAGARHDAQCVFPKLRARLEAISDLPPAEWRVLDVGCGYRCPNVMMFTQLGVPAVGLDVLPAFFRNGAFARWRSEPGLPLPRRIWRFVRERVYAGAYYAELAHLTGSRVDHGALQLVRYDGGAFPFADGSFNIIVSNAVLEHVADLPGFASEVARVLSPRGVFDMLWHNYYSLSGNHLPDDVNATHPWGHLTGATSAPDTAGLNQARPEDIRAAFEGVLDVTHCIPADAEHTLQGEPGFTPEGAELLTGDLRRRLLADYPEDLLLARAFVIQGAARS